MNRIIKAAGWCNFEYGQLVAYGGKNFCRLFDLLGVYIIANGNPVYFFKEVRKAIRRHCHYSRKLLKLESLADMPLYIIIYPQHINGVLFGSISRDIEEKIISPFTCLALSAVMQIWYASRFLPFAQFITLLFYTVLWTLHVI